MCYSFKNASFFQQLSNLLEVKFGPILNAGFKD